MNTQVITAILAVAGAAAAICAAVPASVKSRNPRLWSLLESLAVNVGNAKNSTGPAGSPALAFGAYVLAFAAACLPADKPTPALPPPAVTFVATLPADQTATALSVAVSPAADVTP